MQPNFLFSASDVTAHTSSALSTFLSYELLSPFSFDLHLCEIDVHACSIIMRAFMYPLPSIKADPPAVRQASVCEAGDVHLNFGPSRTKIASFVTSFLASCPSDQGILSGRSSDGRESERGCKSV